MSLLPTSLHSATSTYLKGYLKGREEEEGGVEREKEGKSESKTRPNQPPPLLPPPPTHPNPSGIRVGEEEVGEGAECGRGK